MSLAKISVLASILTVSISSNMVLAQSLSDSNLDSNQDLIAQRFPRSRKRGFRRELVLEKLDLTQQQKQEIKTIREKYRGQISPKKEQLRTMRSELSNLMAGNESADNIRIKHQEMTFLRQEIANLHLESRLEIREILTPTQRSQLLAIQEEYRERIEENLNRP